MFKTIDSKRVFLQILIICLLFSYAKLNIEIENLNALSIGKLKQFHQTKYFRVDLKESPNIKYLSIQVNATNTTNECAIIYYKNDSSFKNRNQIAKSYLETTIMWLNNAQINKTFYLSVICSNQTSNYIFLIKSSEN